MRVAQTANGFRATVSLLRSLDGSKGMSSYTSLPEDCCVQLPVNLGRQMYEDIQKELENLCPGSFAAPLRAP